jgi:hypothetical protein
MRGGINKDVTIQGTFLSGATVKFANNITATKSVDTDTKIVAKVPAAAVTGKITVTNTAGSVSSASDFEVLAVPTISGFLPATGTSGTTIAISGTNLHFNPIVQFFNGVTATIKSVSPTQLLVDVPLGATTGKVSIRTDAVDVPVSSAVNFTVIGKPNILSITPDAGTIQEKVIISGSGFDNIISVNFDGTAANELQPFVELNHRGSSSHGIKCGS